MTASKSAGKAAKKLEKKWQNDMSTLQGALSQLQRDDDSGIDLTALPFARITAEVKTRADKVKVVKAAIKNAEWFKSYGAALAAASYEVIHEEKTAAAAKLAALEAKKARRVEAATANKENIAPPSPLVSATPFPQMQFESSVPATPPEKWTTVVPQNHKTTKEVTTRGNVHAAKLKIAAAASQKAEAARAKAEAQQQANCLGDGALYESAGAGNSAEADQQMAGSGTGWQNQFQQGFRQPLGTSWADDVQQSFDGRQPKGKASKASNKNKKPDEKVKHGMVDILAALSGESKNIIEADAQHEHTFCGDQLGLPIASLYAKLREQVELEAAAARKEKKKQARELALSRQDAVHQLGRTFPDEAMIAKVTLVGFATHPRASLLGLPEKIREQIYRLALVEDGPIQVNSENSKQPGLLRTCQQTRMESLWIFETENSFTIEIVDSQPVVPKNYISHWSRQVFCKLQPKGTPQWDGFKKWLKAYHEDGAPGLSEQADDRSMPWDVCAQAFKLVLSMRELFPDIMFEEMEPMVEIWKKTVTQQQVSWSWA